MTTQTTSAPTRKEQVTLKRWQLVNLFYLAKQTNDLALAAKRLLDGPGRSESDDRLRIEAAFAVANATLLQIDNLLQIVHELDPTIEAEQ